MWTTRIALVREVIRCFDQSGVDVERTRFTVHQHRLRSGVDDGVNGGAERHRRRDHFIAGADSQRHQRKMNGGGSAAYCGRVGRFLVAREFVLELLHPRAQPNPVAAQAIHHRGNLSLANDGGPKHQAVFAHADGCSAHNRGPIVFL